MWHVEIRADDKTWFVAAFEPTVDPVAADNEVKRLRKQFGFYRVRAVESADQTDRTLAAIRVALNH